MDSQSTVNKLETALVEAVRRAITSAAEDELERATKRLKERVPEIVSGVVIQFHQFVSFCWPESSKLQITIDLRKEGPK